MTKKAVAEARAKAALNPDAKPVSAQLVVNPLTGTPTFSSFGSKYRPEYCQHMLQFFTGELMKSGEKLHEKEIENETTKSERPKGWEKAAAEAAKVAAAKEGTNVAAPRTTASGVVITERRKEKRQEWRIVCAELPSFARYARSIGVSHATMKNWSALYPTFHEAYDMCVDMLEDALVQRGLRGQYDAELVKFVGKNWAGMKDRHEVTGADGAPINPPPEYRLVPLAELDAVQATLLAARQRLLEAGGTKD